MKHRRDHRVIWIPGLLNKMVIYTLTMTGFMLVFYVFSGSQQFSDQTVNGIIELVLIFSVSSFFFALCAIAGRTFRNRYFSHLKKQRNGLLLAALAILAFVIVLFALLIVLQTGYGY